MYCFHCGKTMRLIDGVFTCTAGQMPLSSALQLKLKNLFPEERFPTKERPALKHAFRPGITCPGCGCELVDWTCPQCGTNLRSLATRTIELHPHWYPGCVWGIPLVKYDD
jgi:hypothetical protein